MEPKQYPILYVDDDPANRAVIRHNLSLEFSVLLADSGEQALDILAREPVAVLLADQRMPGMSGIELADQVRQLYPLVVRVLITGYSDPEVTVDAINRAQVARFIKKPWTRQELTAVMRESVQTHHNTLLLQTLQERLLQVDRMAAMSVVGASVAHDLREPIAVVEPTLDVIRADMAALRQLELPRAASDLLKTLGEAVNDLGTAMARLTLLIDSLYRSLSGRAVKRDRLDLREVVGSALAIVRGAVVARARLDVQLPDEPVPVTGSEARLMQLAVNLVLNAVQALRPGVPSSRHRVSVRLQATDGKAVLLVEDTGEGIAPEHLGQIFVPFFTTKAAEGTGLGLTICKQIVDDSGGTIEVQSTVGRGTTFTVILPLS